MGQTRACCPVERGGVHVRQVAVVEGRQDVAAEAGDPVELVVMDGIKGAPVAGDVPVQTTCRFRLVEWAREVAGKIGELSRRIGKRGPVLDGPFPVGEPKQFVFLERPTDLSSVLLPVKGRVRATDARREMVAPEVGEPAAVNRVAAAARDDVHRA